jgi:mannose-1-phosphate guanylyltransferase
MKAVVLVGGFGTRLRPLTETVKKELLPLVDRPILDHVLDHLARHGVHEVVLSSPYLEATFHPFIEARHGDPTITWITEPAPLGTGGAVVNALDALGDEPFFALNGDVLSDLDLTAMLRTHREREAEVTISLHRVEDARAFGLVVADRDGRVREFREKPTEPIPGDVNAGTYVLDPSTLRAWTTERELSIEREIFPAIIAGGGTVWGFPTQAYWIDLGTPEKYLQAHFDLLDGKVRGIRYEAPWIAATAALDPDARVGRWVAVGAEARVGAAAKVDRSVIHPGAAIGRRAVVTRTIVGPGAHVGEGSTVEGSVLGAHATIADGLQVIGERVGTDAEASPA